MLKLETVSTPTEQLATVIRIDLPTRKVLVLLHQSGRRAWFVVFVNAQMIWEFKIFIHSLLFLEINASHVHY